MKGIALIRRQIGHLDSVWFLMPHDTVMTFSLALALIPSHYQFLLAECFSSTVSLPTDSHACTHTHSHYQREQKTKTKEEKNPKLFLIIIENHLLFITQWRHFVCYCASHVRRKIVGVVRKSESFLLFIKGNKKYWYSYEKLLVCVSCWAFFF